MTASPGLFRRASDRLRRFFLDPEGAAVALEFSSAGVVGARVETRRGRTELRSLASAPLSAGAFAPALDNPGFAMKEEMRDAVKSVLAKIAAPPASRAALIVPDVVARFRLFAHDEMGADPKQRDAAIAFRMQKLLPFPASDLRVVSAWSRRSVDPVLAIGFSASVLGAYEQVGQAFGLDVGSVETSSMALLHLVPEQGDALLVRHDPAWITLTLVREGWPLSIRSFDAPVARAPEEAIREIASTAVFWKDRLSGQRLDTAIVHAADPVFEALSGPVTSAFGCTPQRAKPPAGLLVAGMPAAVERAATPALALLGAS